MPICHYSYYVILTALITFSCTPSQKNFIRNEDIIPFLEEISIDTFCLNKACYPGVIYLFARNVNDTNFIQTLPTECVFEKSDLKHAFYWKGKLFICKGDTKIFNLLFDFAHSTNKSIHTWKFCEEIGFLCDYDPKTISLIVSEQEIKKVSLSDEMRGFIISGKSPPPPPIDH